MARNQPTNAKRAEVVKSQVPAHPPLTEAERAELVAFSERLQRQPRAPQFKANEKGDVRCADGIDPNLFFARVATAVGTSDTHGINLLMNHAADSLAGDDTALRCNSATALLTGLQPRNELEGMLAVQMVGCHNLAMAMVRRATKADRVDFLATYGNLSAKLLRTFTAQVEALTRLRGQTIKQTVRVEHVHVEAGGQAVVGAVASRAADDGKR